MGVSPSGGRVDSPSSVEIQFSEPLATDQRQAGTILLERIGTDGRVSRVEVTERVGWDGLTIVLPLDQSLAPGRYRISLAANTYLQAASGAILIGGEEPISLGEFSVAEPAAGPFPPGAAVVDGAPRGPTLEEATALAPHPAVPVAIPGEIDASDPASAVRLYKLVVPPGRWYRVGLEVRAGRDGSALDPALALLDGNGRLIAQADRARVDSPGDPFLFQSLAPGTYYIAVSSESHRTDCGDYDSTTGWVARPTADPAGAGAFTLDVVVDPVEAPTSLVSVSIIRADPASRAATGLTLGFDGPMRTTAARIELVDAAGRVWTARSTGYDEATGSLIFLLDEAMPGGSYSLRSSDDAPLVDLGGRPVGFSAGQGRLATVVLADPPPLRPGDLGALLPGPASRGVATTLGLSADGVATGRFVVTQPGLFALRLQGPPGSYRLIGPDGTSLALSGDLDPFGPNGATIDLAEGEYRVDVTGSEPGGAIELGLRCLTVHHDDLLTNGLGQGPAFQLRTITPLGGNGSVTLPAPGSPVLENPMPAAGGDAGGGESLPSGIGTESSWLGGLMGRPVDPASGEATLASQLGGEPGRLATGGQAVSPAQGGLASAGGPGVFWSVEATASATGGEALPPISAPAAGPAMVATEDVSPRAEEGVMEVASLDEQWTEQVLAFLALAEETAEDGGAFLAAPGRAAAGSASESEDAIGLGDYRLGLGIALVTAWGVRHQLRRRRSLEAKGRGRASAKSLAWAPPAGPRWSFARNRPAHPRPRLS